MAVADLGQARKARRVSVSIPANLRHGGGEVAGVEIKDLSFYGFSATSAAPLEAGSYVYVELPVIGPVRARIAWVRGESFGALFPTAVDVRKCVLPDRKA
jgi:hypothetical protein